MCFHFLLWSRLRDQRGTKYKLNSNHSQTRSITPTFRSLCLFLWGETTIKDRPRCCLIPPEVLPRLFILPCLAHIKVALSLNAFNSLRWLQGHSTDKNNLGCFPILSVGLYYGWPRSLLNYHHRKRITLFPWGALLFVLFSGGFLFLVSRSPPSRAICYGAARWTPRARQWQVVFVQLLLRCGLKKLKRAPLLFLGWVFSLERVHERCVRSSRWKASKGKASAFWLCKKRKNSISWDNW